MIKNNISELLGLIECMNTIKNCTALLVHNTTRQVNGLSCLGLFHLLLNIIHLHVAGHTFTNVPTNSGITVGRYLLYS